MPTCAARRRALAGLLLLATVPALAACNTLLGPGVPRYVIFFQPFSANLDDQAMAAITAAAANAKNHPDALIYVSGYAAADASVEANKSLSAARAHIVTDALASNGIDRARMRPKGKGPVDVALDPVEGRRVEISVGAP